MHMMMVKLLEAFWQLLKMHQNKLINKQVIDNYIELDIIDISF